MCGEESAVARPLHLLCTIQVNPYPQPFIEEFVKRRWLGIGSRIGTDMKKLSVHLSVDRVTHTASPAAQEVTP